MIDRTKALLAAGAVTAAVGFGAIGTAMAQDDATPTPTPTPREQQHAPQDRGDRPDHPCPEDEQGSGSSSGTSSTDPVAY